MSAKETITRKSLLMTMFLRDMEKLIAPDRVTVEMIQSIEWKERQKEYVKLFWPVVSQEKGKRNGTTPLPIVRAGRVRVARIPGAKE
jgi:hypothetical protein